MIENQLSGWSTDPLKNESGQTSFDAKTAPRIQYDGEQISNYKPIGYDPGSDIARGYKDLNGNIWSDIPRITDEGTYIEPKLLLSSEIANDPFIASLNLTTEPEAAKNLYNLKTNNPNEYYKQVGDLLERNIYGTLFDNSDSSAYKNALEQLKTLDPQAYYKNKIKFESQAAGWDAAQNEAGRSAGHQDAVKALIPDAIKAGLTPQEINDLYSQYATQASRDNKQFIANRKDNFWAENLAGTLKVGALALAPELGGVLTPALGTIGGGAATGAIMGGLGGGVNAAAKGGNIGQGIIKGGVIGGVGGGVAGGITDYFNTPTISEDLLANYANSTPDPILTMSELKNMTPSELAATLGLEGTSNFGTQAASKIGSKLATTALSSLLSSKTGGTSGTTSGTNAANIANALRNATQPVQEQFGGLYRMNQNPFLNAANQSTVTKNSPITHDFLAELAQEGKPQPTLADLLREA
jgi:hypothetical protein